MAKEGLGDLAEFSCFGQREASANKAVVMRQEDVYRRVAQVMVRLPGRRLTESSSYTKVYSMIYDSGSVPE